MTGLDRLAGSRGTGATAPAGTVTAAAKDGSGSEARERAGDVGTFEAILSDLARPESQAGSTRSWVEVGVPRNVPSAPPRAASDLDPAQPSAADDAESSVAAFVNRFSATGSQSHDGNVVPPRDERETEPPAARDDGPELGDEAGRPSMSAPGNLQHRRRSGLTSEACSDSVASDEADPVRVQTGSSSGFGTGHDLSASPVPLSAASSVGLQPFAVAADVFIETPVETDRSSATCASSPESVLESPKLSDTASHPWSFGRLGRGRSQDGTGDGAISRVPAPIDIARKPDFAERIFDGREDWPPLQGPAREKVTVLAAETHFPPAGILSPVDQIFHRVAAELGAAIAQADPRQPPGWTGETLASRDASATCIRSLTVLLEPASLGPVMIKLRLSGTSLGLEIEADDHETTRLIGRGRQMLSEKLRALGLSVDTFKVTDAGRPRRTP